MTDAPELTELTERMGRLLREAYKLGALKGQQESDAMRTKLLAALGVEHSSSAPEAPRKTKRRPSTSSVARAPKGLVVGALVQIFKTVDGITTKEAETRAVAIDHRINPKTVYNELLRRKDLYRREGDRWFLVEAQNAPAADTKPVWGTSATGKQEPAKLPDWFSARTPVATGEVGGT